MANDIIPNNLQGWGSQHYIQLFSSQWGIHNDKSDGYQYRSRDIQTGRSGTL